jgi:hypothetical protein
MGSSDPRERGKTRQFAKQMRLTKRTLGLVGYRRLEAAQRLDVVLPYLLHKPVERVMSFI